MNIDASQTFEKTNEELNQLIFKIKENSKKGDDRFLFEEKVFDKLISEWKKYRDKVAKLESSVVLGGSLYSTIYSNSLTNSTVEKIESLKSKYSYLIRE